MWCIVIQIRLIFLVLSKPISFENHCLSNCNYLFSDKPKKNTSRTWVMLAHIYRQQGVPGLFSGLVPRLAKVLLSSN